METYLVIALIAAAIVSVICYLLGKRYGQQIGSVRIDVLETKVGELQAKILSHEQTISSQMGELRQLSTEREVQRTKAETAANQLAELKLMYEKQISILRQENEAEEEETRQQNEKVIQDLKESYEKQLAQVKEASEKQLDQLREMNKKQVEDQLALIKEQMKSTSESVLKARQDELGEKNREQMSRIVDPLEQSLKAMKESLEDSKLRHKEALDRLDATIKANMSQNSKLGETADRLTRALTGEVKIQGNFGELKLKQLLEDLGLKDGEQYSSQEHLRDKLGNQIKDDEGRGLIPDFILHFPNKRDVVVDSKMSFTAYERYVNTNDPNEQSSHLKDHLVSLRAQVDRLAKKDYSKYLREGYNKLNFVIMYIHTEGALNLALSNDSSLWREAYDKGVLILGPQTMYMNLRILEMMWTQVRQLKNQEDMMKAAHQIIDRTQDFAKRFSDVETKMKDTVSCMNQLRITTAESGPSIITAARNLIKAGARENKKKKSLEDYETSDFLEGEEGEKLEDKTTY